MNAIFIDTAPLIYLIEGAATMRKAVRRQLADWIEDGVRLRSSVLTLTELLVPSKKAGDDRLVYQYKSALRDLLDAPLDGIDEIQAEQAATIRARHGFSAPDALQLASAQASGCDGFYTNDRRLRGFKELEVILVSTA